MAISIPRAFVEFVLLGPTNDRRQLQDSPILGDVWLAFASTPDKAIELLIAPHREHPAGEVAMLIDERIKRPPEQEGADISPLNGIVAARLYFNELLEVVMPMTVWSHSKRIRDQYVTFGNEESGAIRLNRVVTAIVELAKQWKTGFEGSLSDDLLPAFDRFVALTGLILWAREQNAPDKLPPGAASDEVLSAALENVKAQAIHNLVVPLLERIQPAEELVWQISLNRAATAALDRSIPAVKADAARTLFGVDCSDIAWAVIDSGIQGDHDAFKDADGVSRVRKSFDFSNIRKIVSLDNLKDNEATKARLRDLLHDRLLEKPEPAKARELLTQLANDAKQRRGIHWDLVEPFVKIRPEARPSTSDHGTHVAGVIGASKSAAEKLSKEDGADFVDGMCPDIQLYDFRVLAPGSKETEFAIIAAIQYIRYLNARTEYMTIHGANLSLSIPHDVRNYACGRTPICMECERLVDSGVVVVTAAGNLGYQNFTTREGSYEGYTAFSITDPGNADGVITVGSTHRYEPHRYGVSFFSSRGPTGDGRPKPDLVAPGERIRAPFREGWGDLDGTSMAAPHVSGAAAMLMARYSELIGQPRRIKRILCENATDLGRERSFQGHGMLDVLRTFQSI
ncbi:MAG: S8 family peptidase [Gemmatimonadota bacterium]|nr:S8 family peptidase [Gemmatimonadota bacterium]